MAINKTKKDSFRDKSHLNFMGGPSYDISDPIMNLHIAAASSFFGEPMYYNDPKDTGKKKPRGIGIGVDQRRVRNLSIVEVQHLRSVLCATDPHEWRGMPPAKLMETAIDKALDFDPEKTLQLAAHLRQSDFMRTTPQVIMVRAAHHPKVRGTGLVRKYAREIIKRADEPTVQLAYQLSKYGRKKIPNALKKAWRIALEGFKEFHLAKYRMENRTVKLVDVMNLVHPKSEAVAKLAKGELKLTGDNQTWESLTSAKGSTTETWTEAAGVMGHMALLRNLRNLSQAKVPHALYLQRFTDGAADGKQLPFRYYTAYKQLTADTSPAVLDAIEQCMTTSLGNLPKFNGKVMSLCDNSGSAQVATTSEYGTVTIASIGNLTGVITGMVSDEGYLGVFGDGLQVIPVRKSSSIFDTAKEADRLGRKDPGGTENGIWLFWDKAIREKEHWDSVFVYSDMQAGHGGLYGLDGRSYKNFTWGTDSARYGYGGHQYIDVPKLIQAYRQKVNPNVMVYLVQIAGYQDTIIPEFFDRTYIIGGWGPGLLQFADRMTKLYQGQKEQVIEKSEEPAPEVELELSQNPS